MPTPWSPALRRAVRRPAAFPRADLAGPIAPPNTPRTPTAYRPDIDGLRAFAVLAVVVFHAFPTLLPGGFVGVDVFFVISGYLIAGIILAQLRSGSFRLATFYANRVRRIFPALLAMLLACAVAGWFVLLPQEYSLLGKHIVTGAGFVQNIALQREAGYFDIQSELKPLLHLWSLAIEEQYYLVFPLLMLLTWRAGARLRGLVWALGLLGLLSFALNIHGIRKDLITTFFWPHTRVWELLAGALLAGLEQQATHRRPAAAATNGQPTSPNSPWINTQAWLGLGLMAVSAALFNERLFFPGAWALLPVMGAVLVLRAGPSAWVNRRLLANRPMVAIGLISYPLYLWHWPLLSFAAIVHGGTASPATRAGAVVVAFVLAWLTWRYLERPLRFGARRAAVVPGLAVAMALMALGGYAIRKNDGAENRFPLLASQATFDKWTWGSNPECTARYPELQGIPYCLLGPDQPPQVALIGDSHANQYYPGLLEQGLSVINLGKGSCVPFLDATTHIPLPRPQGEICPPTHLNRTIEFALAQPSVHTIAISGRFQQYHDDESEARITTDLPTHHPQSNPQVFRTTLSATLASLTASGKNIVFILDTPDPLFDPKTCLELPTLRGQAPAKSPCATERTSIDQRHSGYRRTVSDVLRQYPTVKLFDPFQHLCDERWCWATRGAAILYRDTDHLSLEGSRYIASRLAPQLRPTPAQKR
jgi:peptidoglycan/LPS O-acetylase OafA/YrhL